MQDAVMNRDEKSNGDRVVSIIVPVYNVAAYLRECLDSLINQTYQKLEIILVNDGSTDESGVICDEYAQRDSRIQVIHQENKGISAARNAGLKRMREEYLAFVDSDDYVAPDYISYFVSVMEQEKDADMVICRFYNYRQSEGDAYVPIPCVSQPEKRVMSGQEILPRRFGKMKVYYTLPSNKIYKRALFDGIFFPEGRTAEDVWISLDLFCRCEKVICTDKLLYYYRNRKGSISNDPSAKWILAQLDWLERELQFFLDSSNSENAVFPAREYVSMMYKNKRVLQKREKDDRQQYWEAAVKVLLSGRRLSFKDKMKYLFYKMTY